MRDDAIGLWWDERPQPRGARERVLRPMPPIPETGWQPPRDFPNLSAARVIALDTETYDPDLLTHGPGWARGKDKGHIVGVSISADDDGKWYFPVRHTIEPHYNLDADHVFAWLRHTLANPWQPKVGANLVYDIGWLEEEDVVVAGDLFDVQLAEALLTERGDVNLDHLGEKYLGQGKQTSLLYRWLADWYGGEATGKQRANIWRATPRLVGPYAEDDAVMPLRIARKQWAEIARQGLSEVLNMENGLIRLMVKMRQVGVSVDVDRAEGLRNTLLGMQQTAQTQLDLLAGTPVNVNSAEDLAQAFDAVAVKYPRTPPTEAKPEGRPSFTKTWLEHCGHPIAGLVKEIRRVAKLRGTFIESYILDSHINGRIHGQFHLLRGDHEGTRSGRFSSSTPNLQNIPSRDKELAPLVRGIFIPDYGHKQWRRYDYSQIEYRFLVHFAVGLGADEARQRYANDPDTDYHEFVIAIIRELTGYELDRKPAKNINFGLIYGMGILKLLRTLGLDKREGKILFEAYHSALPYVRKTMEAIADEANRTGIITTILGRRSRFELYEPASYGVEGPALPYELAIRRYGMVKRAHIHKGLNRKLQGSAADIIKKAMFECWRRGVFDATGVPRVTVHDELGFSDPGDQDEAFAEMHHILETALPLRVPVRCDLECGPDWGHVS
jgi:DNA polymerase I-like protein with 3'-5' exonuclease and polymerase domains